MLIARLSRYLGTVKFSEGVWAGIEIYGKPMPGGNDGTVDGWR